MGYRSTLYSPVGLARVGSRLSLILCLAGAAQEIVGKGGGGCRGDVEALPVKQRAVNIDSVSVGIPHDCAMRLHGSSSAGSDRVSNFQANEEAFGSVIHIDHEMLRVSIFLFHVGGFPQHLVF